MVPTMAMAEFETGNMLYQRMTGSNIDRMYAIGYVAGVYDATQTIFHCPPNTNTITLGQVYDMVQGYLAQNPAIRHRFVDGLIREVLQRTWPCNNRNSKGAI